MAACLACPSYDQRIFYTARLPPLDLTYDRVIWPHVEGIGEEDFPYRVIIECLPRRDMLERERPSLIVLATRRPGVRARVVVQARSRAPWSDSVGMTDAQAGQAE